jgi:hypothetical protein
MLTRTTFALTNKYAGNLENFIIFVTFYDVNDNPGENSATWSILRCGEITKNEFDSSIFVRKPVYICIYTKVSPFIKNSKNIYLPMRKWLGKCCRPPFRPKNKYFQI